SLPRKIRTFEANYFHTCANCVIYCGAFMSMGKRKRHLPWGVMAFGAVLITCSYIASKHGTLDPCLAAARAVKADCDKFLTVEACVKLTSMSEDSYAEYLADQNTYAGCYLIVFQDEVVS